MAERVEQISFYEIVTEHNDEGWSARNYLFNVMAERGESEEQAINEIVGVCLCALGQRGRPPRRIEFKIVRSDGSAGEPAGS